MSTGDVEYYSKSSVYVLEHALKMVEKHLAWLKSNWGVRLKKRIAKANPMERATYLHLEEKQYKEAVAGTEERIADLKKALAIARKREAKGK